MQAKPCSAVKCCLILKLCTTVTLGFHFAIWAQTADNFNPGANNIIEAVVPQRDGKVLAGGYFSRLGGQPRNYLGRLTSDGTLDTSFNPGLFDCVYCLAVQEDSRILVGCPGSLQRFNPDGTRDGAFNPGPSGGSTFALVVQPDHTILVGGSFTKLGGRACNCIGRINEDGSWDATFNPVALDAGTFTPAVHSIAVQPDGHIVVGGWFTALGGEPHNYIARLNSDGTLDTNFNASADNIVFSLAVQTDGKILLGGVFSVVDGQPSSVIGRLNADGTFDDGFRAEASGYISSMVLQADGKIVVGGSIGTLNGQAWNGIGRLTRDGRLDTALMPGADLTYSLAVQTDGRILAGGGFAMLASQPRAAIGRLNNTEPATEGLHFDGANITWLRGGTSPELWVTSFAASTNGTDWTSLGGGTRISGGWQLNGVSVPATGTIRATGFASGGWHNGSSWPVTTFTGPPLIVMQPVAQTNNEGTVASFRVAAVGATPLAYQWYKDGISLGDGGNVSGSQTPSLALNNVLGKDGGRYCVIITNGSGSITSLVSVLTVVDPLITKQPSSRTNDATSMATFTTLAGGTIPMSYQWLKNGGPLADGEFTAGVHMPNLTLGNVLGRDAGQYSVTVSNAFGSVTSAGATLSVVDPLISLPPVSRTAIPGQTCTLTVTARGTAPLNYQWCKDGNPILSATADSLTFTNVLRRDAGCYSVQVSNTFGVLTSASALLTVNLARVDSLNAAADGVLYSAVLQPDGKVLAGGYFTTLTGQPCTNIGRFNGDGTLEEGFNPGPNGTVSSLIVEDGDEILVGGFFTLLAGQARTSIGRLDAKGTLDATFAPVVNGSISCMTLQTDGKIVVGGNFTSLGNQPRSYIGRLNSDGLLDMAFNPGASNSVSTLALQADGKILVGGRFTKLGGQTRNYLGRLNASGTLDTGFNPVADGYIHTIALQADGKIVVAGLFMKLGGQSRNFVGRLNPNGTLDNAFDPQAGGPVYSLAFQADGKILLGGVFTTLGGRPRSYIGRINNDGTLDSTFDPGADGPVYSLALQPDGNILVAGAFRMIGGLARAGIGRLINSDPVTQNLVSDGTTITWLRGGTAPEVEFVTFDASADGTNWARLGMGARIPGGWCLSGVTVGDKSTIRARGFMTGGQFNGSGSFVESRYPYVAPTILVETRGLGLDSSGFGCYLVGNAGAIVVVQASTDLRDWVDLGTNILSTGLSYFNDPGATNFPQRFYRARLQ